MREQQNVWLDLKGYLQKFPDVCSSTRCEPGIDRCGVLFLYGRSLRRRKRQRPIRHYLERISSTVPQGNPGASEIEEGALSGEQMLMTDQQAWELAKPGVGSFDDPTPFVAAQFAPIFVAVADCSPGKARSTRCRVSAIAGATDPNRRRCRQSPFPAFVADGLWVAEPRLLGAWLPQA